MRLNRPLRAAAFLSAAAMVTQSFAQDAVPTPPPPGVPAKGPRAMPTQPGQAAPSKAVPMVDDQPLPQIPENPIKLEQNAAPAAAPAPVVEPMPGTMPPVAHRHVKPIGPVYYYAPVPYVMNVTTPPAMHIPNSPYVEDLSVDGDHGRYVYYSYRRPWYTPGHMSANVTIVW